MTLRQKLRAVWRIINEEPAVDLPRKIREVLGPSPEERVLRKQGFAVYCPQCQVLLNDNQWAFHVADGIYQWECPQCKKHLRFDLDHPVPLIVH